jgi:hypothetical protein
MARLHEKSAAYNRRILGETRVCIYSIARRLLIARIKTIALGGIHSVFLSIYMARALRLAVIAASSVYQPVKKAFLNS